MRDLTIPLKELNEFDLPPVCIVTGQTEGVTFKPVKFTWYPRWVNFFVLLNLLIALLIAAVATRRANGHLPFTEEAWRAWRQGRILFPTSLVAGILLIIGGTCLLVGDAVNFGLPVFVLGIALPIACHFRFVRNKGPVVHRIDKETLTLSLPSSEATQAFQERLYPRRRPLASRPTLGRLG
ncbi:hypothetical protein DRW03_10890 [Corallococcus sp. H22C18031201]|uniref:hypothetical protein n=1 Tax=Citreicoccus inhibens TaxID=2849499 RepID=UPI000E736378|nr:hypothetical protein [Citreicoccus inhibens]MBU8898730.1 hypothetical protein [Citreicoccus inhibens]RJS24104.1 hypothetical protein DRW03_10890 [Corallococcus sp. H22C18031201]